MPLNRPKPRSTPPARWVALAGLETGMFAGFLALTYLALDGALRGDGPWRVFNLIAAGLFPYRPLSYGFSTTTLAGMATEMIVAGVAGVCIALLMSPFWHFPLRRRLIAVLFSFFWYYLSFRLAWAHLNPVLTVKQPFPGMIVAHLVFGFAMALAPRLMREWAPASREPGDSAFL